MLLGACGGSRNCARLSSRGADRRCISASILLQRHTFRLDSKLHTGAKGASGRLAKSCLWWHIGLAPLSASVGARPSVVQGPRSKYGRMASLSQRSPLEVYFAAQRTAQPRHVSCGTCAGDATRRHRPPPPPPVAACRQSWCPVLSPCCCMQHMLAVALRRRGAVWLAQLAPAASPTLHFGGGNRQRALCTAAQAAASQSAAADVTTDADFAEPAGKRKGRPPKKGPLLLLVESPAKARKIQEFLGPQYTVRGGWCGGRV
jgi:hypothetical protein